MGKKCLKCHQLTCTPRVAQPKRLVREPCPFSILIIYGLRVSDRNFTFLFYIILVAVSNCVKLKICLKTGFSRNFNNTVWHFDSLTTNDVYIRQFCTSPVGSARVFSSQKCSRKIGLYEKFFCVILIFFERWFEWHQKRDGKTNFAVFYKWTKFCKKYRCISGPLEHILKNTPRRERVNVKNKVLSTYGC